MGAALRASGRDIVYSLCQYGRNNVWTWGPQVGGNLWRTTGDIGDSWDSMTRIVAVDQDSLGRQGRRVRADGLIEIRDKPLGSGAHAIGLFNRGQSPARISVRWSEVGMQGPRRVRDLWAHRDAGRLNIEYSVDVEPHGVALLRVEP